MRAVGTRTTQIQMETIRLRMELEEQLQITSSGNEVLTQRIDQEIVVMYNWTGEMATFFVAQWEEHNHKLNGVLKQLDETRDGI